MPRFPAPPGDECSVSWAGPLERPAKCWAWCRNDAVANAVCHEHGGFGPFCSLLHALDYFGNYRRWLTDNA